MLSAQLNRHRLRALREDRELTTAQVGSLVSAELGRTVHQSTISRFENGARQPGARMFGALCRVLRVEKPELLIPNEVASSTPSPSETAVGPAGAAPGTKASAPIASAVGAPHSEAS
jgi:transcriptional regulator with XRE-family HTH domain